MPQRALRRCVLTVVTGFITACGSGGSTGPNPGARTPARVAVRPGTLAIAVGSVDTLTATVYDSADSVIPDAPVTFASNDPTIVTVSASGVLTAVSNGTTSVAARSDSAFAAIVVEVSYGVLVRRISLSGGAFGAAVSSTGVTYVTEPDLGTVVRVNPQTGAVEGTIAAGAFPTSVAFNGAGTRAYVGDQTASTVTVIDVSAGTASGTITVPGNPIAELVGPGDSLLFVASNADEVYTVRVPANAIVDSVATPDFSNAMILHGSHVWVSVPYAGQVIAFNAFTRQVLHTIVTGGTTQGLAVSSDESELYLANGNGLLQIWKVGTGMQVAGVSLSGGAGFGLAQHPGDGLLYVTTTGAKQEVDIVDPVARAQVGFIPTGGIPRRIAFTAEGDVGVAANEYGWVDVIR